MATASPDAEKVGRPRLTVVIATRNRATSLSATLAGLARQDLPAGELEVLVADNGSSDATPDVVRDSGFARLEVPVPGKSRALNAGFQTARAPCIATTDDDTVPPPGWARALLDGFARHPGAAAVGGAVTGVWPAALPAWLRSELVHLAGILDPVSHDVRLPEGRWLLGASMAVSRDWFQRAGGRYREELGPAEGRYRHNEENELIDRMRQLGGEIWMLAGSEIAHVMTPDRLSREYFEGKSLVQGQSDAVVAELRQPTGWADALLQLPVWLGRARRAAAAVDEGSGERASDDPEAFARHCWRLQVLGHAQERVQLMRRRILLQPL